MSSWGSFSPWHLRDVKSDGGALEVFRMFTGFLWDTSGTVYAVFCGSCGSMCLEISSVDAVIPCLPVK